jgi:hypothetical protein
MSYLRYRECLISDYRCHVYDMVNVGYLMSMSCPRFRECRISDYRCHVYDIVNVRYIIGDVMSTIS